MKTPPAIASPDDPRHGSYAGARAHQYYGLPLCDPCGDAYLAYEVARGRGTGNPAGRPSIVAKASKADVDEVVVARHMAWRPCPANAAERLEIVRLWRAQGRPMRQLESLVAWNVYRYVRVLRDVA